MLISIRSESGLPLASKRCPSNPRMSSSSRIRAMVAVQASFFEGMRSVPSNAFTRVDLPEDMVAMTLTSNVGSRARSKASSISGDSNSSLNGPRLPSSKKDRSCRIRSSLFFDEVLKRMVNLNSG